jgi:intracellular septation protein A
MKKENPLINIVLNVILPSFILIKLSDVIGPVYALLLALSFPVGYGIFDFITRKKWNIFSIIGFISVMLTGGIGLLALPSKFLVMKETAVPLVLGIVVLFSQKSKNPLLKLLLGEVFDLTKIKAMYQENGKGKYFRKHLKSANYLFAITFFVSAILNFIVATVILQSEPGTPAYTAEIGKMTALSYPIIVLPTMVMMFVLFIILFKRIEKHTGKNAMDFVKG